MTDVLPETYETWTGLNQKESQKIALSLTPEVSDGWLSLREEGYYVADSSQPWIGTIKGQSTVSLRLNALHGTAFPQTIHPQYRFVFLFEFLA